MSHSALVLLLLVGGLVQTTSPQAQSIGGPAPVPGFQRDQAYIGAFPFEHIDTGSGNLLLTFTDLALPGYNGMDLVFQRTFNSANQNWVFGLAGIPMRVRRVDGPGGSPPDFENPDGLPLILTSDGGARRTWWEGGDYNSPSPVFRTAEFWRYHVDGRRLELPNGVECYYDDRGYLREVRDRFSNWLEIENEEYAGGSDGRRPTGIIQHLGDGHTRTLSLGYQFVTTPSGTFSILTSATYAPAPSDVRTWTYGYGGPLGWNLTTVTPPEGPGWSFDHQNGLEVDPSLTVTLPQGGRIIYEFVAASPGHDEYGALKHRTLKDGDTVVGEWQFDLEPESPTSFNYRRVVTGRENVRLVFGYEPGPAIGGAHVLRWREVRNSDTGGLLEREDRDYVTTAVSDMSGAVRNLLRTATIKRDSDPQGYTTTLSYKTGTSAERFSDYGRPYLIEETGDAGTRVRSRTFDYAFTGHLIDKVASETITVGTDSHTRSWEYVNETGALLSATRFGITTNVTANPSTGAIAETIDPHGHSTTFAYDWGALKDTETEEYTIGRSINPDGTVASETRRGFTTTYDYDDLGRLEFVGPPIGHGIVTTYDNQAGRFVTTSRGPAGESWTKTTMDAFGRVTGTENAVGVKTAISYDALGRKSSESAPFDAVEPAAPRTFSYDPLNRLTSVTNADESTVTYRYVNRIDLEITDEENHKTLQNWAAFGDPSDAHLVGVTDAENQAWTYDYNGLGQLTGVTQPGGPARSWTYVPNSDLVQQEVHPESGTTTYTYDGGRLATKTTARGTLTYGYDTNDRLTSIDAPGTAYDVSVDYDASDNRTLLQNTFVSSTFEFDGANRLKWRKDTLTGQPLRQTSYGYDGWDNIKTLTYPSGTVISYDYDTAGRITAVFREPGSNVLAQVLSYHPSGAIKTLKTGNDIVETYTYDTDRRWLEQIAGGPTALTYTYDHVGNVTAIADSRPEFNQTFLYDGVDRLRFVSGWGANEYRYDHLGNRTFKQSPGVTYTYNAQTKRLDLASGALPNPEVGSYGYDAVGNLESDPSGTYTYTPFNMLETATIAGAVTTYRYDGDHQRRVTIIGATTRYSYGDGQRLLSQFTGAAWTRDHVYLGSRLVASLTPTPPAPPTVTAQPSSQTVEAGQSVTFSAAASGVPSPTVQWQVSVDAVNWSNIAGATASSYGFSAVATDNGKRFRAVFTNASGSATTNVAVLTVTCTPAFTPATGVLPAVAGATSAVSMTLPASCPWSATSAQNWLGVTGSASGTGSSAVAYAATRPNLLLRPRSGTLTVAGQPYSVTQRAGPHQTAVVLLHKGDYDGDGKTDVAVYRNITAPASEAGRWLIRLASGATMDVQWGSPALDDIPVPADYDGDGKTDIAVYRNIQAPPESGKWLIRKSSGGTVEASWGAPALGDIPVPADYDNDGVADLAVYRRTTAEWFIAKSSGGTTVVVWGQTFLQDPYTVGYNGDMPVPADYTGDGVVDVAVYRDDPTAPTTAGHWFVEGPGPGVSWGSPLSGDVPVHANYVGSAAVQLAVYRPTTGQWFIVGQPVATWGSPALDDVPVRGDYDGDGLTDLAVYRNTSGEWSILRTTDGLLSLQWGSPALGDVPVR